MSWLLLMVAFIGIFLLPRLFAGPASTGIKEPLNAYDAEGRAN